MKILKRFIIVLLLTIYQLSSSVFAQQWDGDQNITGSIFRMGKVGIGTNNPGQRLHVSNGSIAIEATGRDENNRKLIFTSNTGNNTYGFKFSWRNDDWSPRRDVLFFDKSGDVYLTGGNVGIGTTIPQSKLSVNGKITAKEVQVISSGWGDFVFEKEYCLKPLQEVEDFINTNGHLPDIPSAEEINDKGLNIGEMQSKLLQKIEELTLYLIEQNKKLVTFENENKELKKQISSLKTKQILN